MPECRITSFLSLSSKPRSILLQLKTWLLVCFMSCMIFGCDNGEKSHQPPPSSLVDDAPDFDKLIIKDVNRQRELEGRKRIDPHKNAILGILARDKDVTNIESLVKKINQDKSIDKQELKMMDFIHYINGRYDSDSIMIHGERTRTRSQTRSSHNHYDGADNIDEFLESFSFGNGAFAGFYSLEEYHFLMLLLSEYEFIGEPIRIGWSCGHSTECDQGCDEYDEACNLNLGKHPIYAFKVSDNPDIDESADEPQVLYTGLHHAREPMSAMSLFYYLFNLIADYTSDTPNPLVKALIEEREMWFIPIINPDGYQFNEEYWYINNAHASQRKNLHIYDYEADDLEGYEIVCSGFGQGTDLNRNYLIEAGDDEPNSYAERCDLQGLLGCWDFYGETNDWEAQLMCYFYHELFNGSSCHPCSLTYHGTQAFSEPETDVIRHFIAGKNFKIALNNHTYSQLLVHPPLDDLPAPLNADVYRELAEELVSVNDYYIGTPEQTVGYAVRGDACEYMAYTEKIYAFTPEIGETFWVDQGSIIPVAHEALYMHIAAAGMSGAWLDIPSAELEIGNADTENQHIPITWSFNIKNLGLGAATNVSATLEYIECALVGDTDGDLDWTILDLVSISNMILDGAYDPCLDINDDDELDILDIIVMTSNILGDFDPQDFERTFVLHHDNIALSLEPHSDMELIVSSQHFPLPATGADMQFRLQVSSDALPGYNMESFYEFTYTGTAFYQWD